MKRAGMAAVALVLVAALALAAFSIGRALALFTDTASVPGNTFTADTHDPPTGLTATGGASADLSWTATADTYASGHRVLRGTASGGPYSQIAEVTPRTTTTYTDSPADGTYYYVLRSFYQNWESANSNEASATISSGARVERANAWTTGLTHTVGTGSDRLLLFVVGYENGSDPGVSAVTYGGQSLTPIIGAVAGTTIFGRVELWYLNEAGIAAASGNTFSVTWGGAAPSQPMYAAATYKNVNQSNTISDSASNSTNTSTPNPITATVNVTDGAMAVSGAISGNNGSYTWGGGWSEGTDQTSGATTNMSSAENPATANGTDTASATHSGPNRQAIVAAVLNPSRVSIANAWTTGLTHTAGSGSDRLLVFIAGMENGMAGGSPPAGDRDLTAVTYGGQSLTPAAEVVVCSGSPNSFCIRTELWYLDEAGIQAATGSTFSPTWSGDPPFELEEYYTAVTLDNVDQSSPIGNSSTNGTTTANPIQTSSALVVSAGDLVVVSPAAGAAGSYTPGSGYTEGTDQSALSSTMATAYKAIAAAGTEQPSMQFDLTINRQVILAAVINVAP